MKKKLLLMLTVVALRGVAMAGGGAQQEAEANAKKAISRVVEKLKKEKYEKYCQSIYILYRPVIKIFYQLAYKMFLKPKTKFLVSLVQENVNTGDLETNFKFFMSGLYGFLLREFPHLTSENAYEKISAKMKADKMFSQRALSSGQDAVRAKQKAIKAEM